MNKTAIFDFIKKNLLSLICAFVAILSIVALFYPLSGMTDDELQAANTRAGNYNTLTGYNKPRKLPVTDPTKSAADAGDLKVFPNAAINKAGDDIASKLIQQSGDALKYIKNLSAEGHTLLVPAVLPDAASQTTALSFAEVYTRVLSSDRTISAKGDPTAVPPVAPDPKLVTFKALNIQNDILHGSVPPTPKEIEDAGNKLYADVYFPRIFTRNGQPVNKTEVDAEWTIAKGKLPQQMKEDVALKFKMYVEPKALEVNPNISVNVAPAPADIWYAQTALWVQQDIAEAIASANEHSNNILDAQVKHLISLTIDPPPMYTFPPGTNPDGSVNAGAGALPSPATETQALPIVYTVSPTGRASNGMYDVIHFKLVIDVDAKHVNDVLQAFSKGRLISIYRQDLYSLDTVHEASANYLYGDNRVIRLGLQGEILFLRSWTTPWMPDRIKQVLGLTAPAPGGAGGPTGAFPPGGPNFPSPGAR